MNEYEAQYFGFTAHTLVTCYYNTLIQSWAKIVEEYLVPELLKHADRTVKKTSITALRNQLLDRVFQCGKLDVLLKMGEDHLSKYVIKIPKNVTLPADEENASIKRYDEANIMSDIDKLTTEIVELKNRLKLAQVERMLKEALTAFDSSDEDQGKDVNMENAN